MGRCQFVVGLVAALAFSSVLEAQRANPRAVQPRGQGGPINQGTPSMPFKSLFERDEAGNPVPVDGSTDLRAMYNNGFIGELTWERAIPHIRAWQEKIDRLVAENADVLVDLDVSIFPKYDQDDTNTLLYVNDAVQLLISAGSLTNYLEEQGVLTRIQAGQNRRIVSDYQQQFMVWSASEAQERFGDDMDKQMAFVTTSNYREALRDTLETYEDALEAIVKNPDAVESSLAEAIRGSGTMEEKIERLKAALSEAEYAQQRALLEAGLELRPEARYGPNTPDTSIKHRTIEKPGGVKILSTPEDVRKATQEQKKQNEEGGG